ncbi:MAG TPA: calcium-binding protein [Actinomycetota bacterium]|nr:calcium-binding protein [Actinomycetota bacterium]
MRRVWLVPVLVMALLVPAAPASADVIAEFALGILTVRGDGEADTIVIECANGNVRVNDEPPSTGRARCERVRSILVRAGGGDDDVDLSAVRRREFDILLEIGVFGEGGDDTVIGSQLADRIDGGAGEDTLRGGRGADTLVPGPGGGAVAGGPGSDVVVVSGAGSWVILDRRILHRDRDEITTLKSVERLTYRGGVGRDEVDATAFSGRLFLDGGPGADVLLGGPGHDLIRGKGGDDRLHGGPGNDLLEGGPGDDELSGGPGDDQLQGGPGDDRCVGGPGADSLVSC